MKSNKKKQAGNPDLLFFWMRPAGRTYSDDSE